MTSDTSNSSDCNIKVASAWIMRQASEVSTIGRQQKKSISRKIAYEKQLKKHCFIPQQKSTLNASQQLLSVVNFSTIVSHFDVSSSRDLTRTIIRLRNCSKYTAHVPRSDGRLLQQYVFFLPARNFKNLTAALSWQIILPFQQECKFSATSSFQDVSNLLHLYIPHTSLFLSSCFS